MHITSKILPLSALLALTFAGCRQEASGADGSGDGAPLAAVCNLVAVGGSGVTGTIRFTQEGDAIRVQGEVTGLTPGDHGFHVHEKGDLSDKETGKSAGGHFDPEGHEHGKPGDDKRHVGDLGNITADAEGKAVIDMTDSVIALSGDHSILGRSIVVHADKDDGGQPTGNAGARVAFGKIEAASSDG